MNPDIQEPNQPNGQPEPGADQAPPRIFTPNPFRSQSSNLARPMGPGAKPNNDPASEQIPQPTVFGSPDFPSIPPPNSGKKPSKKNRLFAFLIIPIVVLLGGYAFGYYIPNRPENIWKSGVSRSGEALDKLVTKITDQKTLDAFKKSEMELAVDANFIGGSFKGALNAKFDSTKSDGALNLVYKQDGMPDQAIDVKFLSELAEGADFPDSYFKFSGLSGLGLDVFLPGISEYEDKWISISKEYFQSLGLSAEDYSPDKQLNSGDIGELARAATAASVEHVFTTDDQKAVFINKGFVGKEKIDGQWAYRYKVGTNKNNLKNYCKSLVERVFSTNAYKKMPWIEEGGVDKDKESAIKSCEDDNNYKEIGDDDIFELWIDAKYKLIYKIRISDKKDSNTYTDIGQVYKGGDDIKLFVNYHDDKSQYDIITSVETNIKTAVTTGTFEYKGLEEGSQNRAKITLSAKPYSGDIKIEKPAESIPLEKILEELYGGLFSGGGSTASPFASTQMKARDTERQTDIKALHGQLEAFYAQNGYYPGLADVNSSTWRAANLRGLDSEALQDPTGSSAVLASAPATNVYSYQVSGCTGTKCTAYTLTATLEEGGTYVKQSLN